MKLLVKHGVEPSQMLCAECSFQMNCMPHGSQSNESILILEAWIHHSSHSIPSLSKCLSVGHIVKDFKCTILNCIHRHLAPMGIQTWQGRNSFLESGDWGKQNLLIVICHSANCKVACIWDIEGSSESVNLDGILISPNQKVNLSSIWIRSFWFTVVHSVLLMCTGVLLKTAHWKWPTFASHQRAVVGCRTPLLAWVMYWHEVCGRMCLCRESGGSVQRISISLKLRAMLQTMTMTFPKLGSWDKWPLAIIDRHDSLPSGFSQKQNKLVMDASPESNWSAVILADESYAVLNVNLCWQLIHLAAISLMVKLGHGYPWRVIKHSSHMMCTAMFYSWQMKWLILSPSP